MGTNPKTADKSSQRVDPADSAVVSLNRTGVAQFVTTEAILRELVRTVGLALAFPDERIVRAYLRLSHAEAAAHLEFIDEASSPARPDVCAEALLDAEVNGGAS